MYMYIHALVTRVVCGYLMCRCAYIHVYVYMQTYIHTHRQKKRTARKLEHHVLAYWAPLQYLPHSHHTSPPINPTHAPPSTTRSPRHTHIHSKRLVTR